MQRNRPPLSYVSVMQGCDNFCSYCIVPYVRGRERSRHPDAIVGEVRSLAEAGYREVMLLGQNVNSYGKGMDTSFAALLERVARETGMPRIRFMTSHPKDVPDALIEAMAKHDSICKQLHLPVQSGSTDVLRRMNRKYTREQYLALVERVRAALPGVSLTTDIIVGFPGETERDYADTLSLVEQVRFDAAYTFVYSVRAGTKAADMPDQIPEEEKRRRIVELVAAQGRITFENNQACVGARETVLVEDISRRDEHSVCGRTDAGRMVNLPGDAALVGQFVDVKIIEGKKTTLLGRRVDESGL